LLTGALLIIGGIGALLFVPRPRSSQPSERRQ
jgi:hypothetical protein